MTRTRARAAAVGLVAVATLLAGCAGKREERGGGGGERAAPMPPAERKRGEDACTTYVRQLCACARVRPDDAALAERCHLKQAKVEALDLALQVDDDPAASDDSRLRAQVEARKIIAKCFEETAQLPTLGCR